jgi:ABC-2 type transport system permease protein
MAGTWTIYRRELAGLFLGPLAWVLLALALLVNGYFFAWWYLPAMQGDVGESLRLALGLSWPFWLLMVLLPPLITMRMISEESSSGMLEFLLTAPVRDGAVVLGKLLAATTLMAILWSSALVYALAVTGLGTPPDWGPVWTGVAGAALVSALFCALGLVASACTSTPILAAFLALVFEIVLLSVPLLAQQIGLPRDHWLRQSLVSFDVIARFQGSFVVGVIDSHHLVFFGAWTAFLAFLATRLLEARRWR